MDWLVERLALAPGKTVVDLAAGTGKLTRMLVPTGARVIAVEPVEEMLVQLRLAVPEAEALAGTAEAIPLPDASAHAVTVAQAFHWFETKAALAELARVIRAGGGVGLVWNARDLRDELQRALEDVLAPVEAPVSWQRSLDVEAAFAASREFGPIESFEVPFVQWLDAEGLVDRVASVSYVAITPDDERVALLDRVRALAERREQPFAFRYVTQVYIADRR